MSDSATQHLTTTESPPEGPGTTAPPSATHEATRRSWLTSTFGGEMLAEFFGTFVLIAFGCGSVAVAVVGLPGSGREAVAFGPANWLIIAWGWGFGVVAGVYVSAGI